MADEQQPVPSPPALADPTTQTPISPSSSTSAPAPHPRSSSLIQTLRVYMTIFASKTDHTLVRLNTLLSTPRGTDVLLCTLSYTLQLLSALLSRHLDAQMNAITATFAEKADAVLLPGESFVAAVPISRGTRRLQEIATGTKALSGVIADFRIFVRLWGCVGLYVWLRDMLRGDAVRKNGSMPKKEKAVRAITYAEIVSLIAFQVLENGAYLASKGVLTSASWSGELGKRRETRWWVWSCRFWALYVILEGVRLGALWYYEPEGQIREDDGEKEDKIARERKSLENKVWWRDLVSNVAYFPMTLHWSTEEGLLSEILVGLCGVFAGGANLVEAWAAIR
ncbi:hypothetical protein M011DRAFT_488566 [Sporormia fimetaria CBS 119925]|uniref:Peroxin 11C n=1 Tax=Sporormia fimetaria CBS 119925 TaxID=1340428 RepID=A0A6A6V5P9_9PLEO|nr:hypothetical protein M011DRAFT_488566 [Sporormia fimetaria CBS 119925]